MKLLAAFRHVGSSAYVALAETRDYGACLHTFVFSMATTLVHLVKDKMVVHGFSDPPESGTKF